MFGPLICETQEMLDGAKRAIQIAESLGLSYVTTRKPYGPSGYPVMYPAYAPISHRFSRETFGNNDVAIYITPAGFKLYTNIEICSPVDISYDPQSGQIADHKVAKKTIRLLQTHECSYQNANWNLVETLLKKLLDDIAAMEIQLDAEEIRESGKTLADIV